MRDLTCERRVKRKHSSRIKVVSPLRSLEAMWASGPPLDCCWVKLVHTLHSRINSTILYPLSCLLFHCVCVFVLSHLRITYRCVLYHLHFSVYFLRTVALVFSEDTWQCLETFLVSQLKGECYWHQVVRGQRGCSASSRAQKSLRTKTCPAHMSVVPSVRNPALEGYSLTWP